MKMTRKTVKDLDGELSQLKVDFTGLQLKINELLEKHNYLEQEHNKCENTTMTTKPVLKCNLCELVFQRAGGLKKHRNNNHRDNKQIKCEECGKYLMKNGNIELMKRFIQSMHVIYVIRSLNVRT